MVMEPVTSPCSQVVDMEPYLDLTKPISNWFKPTCENVTPPLSRVTSSSLPDKDNLQFDKCKSIIGCTSMTLKGFEYCHKHILEDKSSPFRRCSYISKSDYRRCRNPTPVVGEKPSYCILHDKERKRDVSKSKAKKKKKRPTTPHEKSSKKRPSTLSVPVPSSEKKASSSDEEEFNFFTDTVQLNKTDCLWLGNQASDAESTDSEDENLLNHAGVWTLEECIRILKEKMMRLRYLYSLQYKRLNHRLREERRKMLKDYDMDGLTLSKVGFDGCSDESFQKFVEGVHLTNYQKLGGPELVAEKLSREKRIKGVSLRTRKNDVPRCMFYADGHRCYNKMLPLSKYCYNHVTNDLDQHLFSTCSFKFQDGKRCTEPASTFSSSCLLHPSLLSNKSYEKAFDIFQNAKQRCENRKRRILEREREKREPRVKRSSARLKECSLSTSSNEDRPLMEIKNDRDKTSHDKNRDKVLQEDNGERTFQRERYLGNENSSPTDGNIFDKGLFRISDLPTKSTSDTKVGLEPS